MVFKVTLENRFGVCIVEPAVPEDTVQVAT
jgi:hypothetical protein